MNWNHSVIHTFFNEETGMTVKFEEWHSEYLDEDFVGVTVYNEHGKELMHSGMTHVEISEESAQQIVESVDMLLEEL